MTPRLLYSRRARHVLVATLVPVLLIVAGLFFALRDPRAPSADAPAPEVTPYATATGDAPTAQPHPSPRGSPRADEVTAAQLARLRDVEPVSATAGTPKITGEASTQPDLYASEFVRRLLTQDYRTPRGRLVAWVQAESATTTEALVVGKVPPELRDRLAVFTTTDTAGGPAPIPSQAEWDGLTAQHAFTTVAIDRVEEPFSWTNAVASGRISDPGVTARQVTATVTRHWTGNGPHTSQFSVSVLLNLEGPPSRRDWGFVAVVSYTSIQVR